MKTRLIVGLTAMLLAPLMTGCTTTETMSALDGQSSGIVRGQSPACGPCGPGAAAAPSGGMGCMGAGCRGCGGAGCMNLPFAPVHRNYYTVDAPQNLQYPEPNTPAAAVNYPYYTHRGPTDFFMQ